MNIKNKCDYDYEVLCTLTIGTLTIGMMIALKKPTESLASGHYFGCTAGVLLTKH